MYIALCLLLLAILVGRAGRNFVPQKTLSKCAFFAVLFLLFLLGVQIGANDELFDDLPELGARAFLLMLFCVAGSILAVKLIARFLAGRGLSLNGKNAR